MLVIDRESAYKQLSAKEMAMTDKDSARDEATIAARIRAAAVVTRLQSSGTHWTLTAKPEKAK
jgi:hypothetical protein